MSRRVHPFPTDSLESSTKTRVFQRPRQAGEKPPLYSVNAHAFVMNPVKVRFPSASISPKIPSQYSVHAASTLPSNKLFAHAYQDSASLTIADKKQVSDNMISAAPPHFAAIPLLRPDHQPAHCRGATKAARHPRFRRGIQSPFVRRNRSLPVYPRLSVAACREHPLSQNRVLHSSPHRCPAATIAQ